jgi:hypothetical protein
MDGTGDHDVKGNKPDRGSNITGFLLYEKSRFLDLINRHRYRRGLFGKRKYISRRERWDKRG